MLYTDRGTEIPCLKPEDIDTRHMDEDEKRDLTDPEMMDTDVIRVGNSHLLYFYRYLMFLQLSYPLSINFKRSRI